MQLSPAFKKVGKHVLQLSLKGAHLHLGYMTQATEWDNSLFFFVCKLVSPSSFPAKQQRCSRFQRPETNQKSKTLLKSGLYHPESANLTCFVS